MGRPTEEASATFQTDAFVGKEVSFGSPEIIVAPIR
jgi:hypothetical protein